MVSFRHLALWTIWPIKDVTEYLRHYLMRSAQSYCTKHDGEDKGIDAPWDDIKTRGEVRRVRKATRGESLGDGILQMSTKLSINGLCKEAAAGVGRDVLGCEVSERGRRHECSGSLH